MKHLTAAALCLALLCSVASADIIASQPLDFNVESSGWFSQSGWQQIAEDFVVGVSSTAKELTWWGSTGDPVNGFDILFFNDVAVFPDVAGLPDVHHFYSHSTGALAGVFVGNDPDNAQSTSVWNTTIPDAVFSSPGTYWITIRASSGGTWVWQHATASGVYLVLRLTDNEAWQFSNQGERSANAFIIEGTIPEPVCPWDCSQPSDGSVGIADFLLLLAQWGGPGTCDIDGDSVTGINDFLALLAAWGACP